MRQRTTEERANVSGEMREMKVGETRRYPIERYNTARSARFSSLIKEVVNDGAWWDVKANREDKCIEVTRVS